MEPDAVSSISVLGKALLNAEVGDWITLEADRSAKIDKIEYRNRLKTLKLWIGV